MLRKSKKIAPCNKIPRSCPTPVGNAVMFAYYSPAAACTRRSLGPLLQSARIATCQNVNLLIQNGKLVSFVKISMLFKGTQ
jgi:hypothetical protein